MHDNFPAETTTITATERMAAHFCRYRAVFPAAALLAKGATPQTDLLLMDRSDGWDPLVRAGNLDGVIDAARATTHVSLLESGPIVLMQRRAP